MGNGQGERRKVSRPNSVLLLFLTSHDDFGEK